MPLRERSPFGVAILKRKRLLAALAVTATLLGWHWHSSRLSPIERKLVGKWEESSDGFWVLNSSGTAQIDWVPYDHYFRGGGTAPAKFDSTIRCDWKVRDGMLILKEHYRPLSANSPVLARIQHWLNYLRKPTTHRLPVLLRTEHEVVLRKWAELELHEKNVTLQPVGSIWPSPTQRMIYAAYVKLREDRRAAQWGKRSPPL